MEYKVTQEGNIQGIEPFYNQTIVSEDYLESQVRQYLEPYFQYMMVDDDNEEEIVEIALQNKSFYFEDIAFGSNIEIIIEEV